MAKFLGNCNMEQRIDYALGVFEVHEVRFAVLCKRAKAGGGQYDEDQGYFIHNKWILKVYAV